MRQKSSSLLTDSLEDGAKRKREQTGRHNPHWTFCSRPLLSQFLFGPSMIQVDPVYSLKNAYISIKAEATFRETEKLFSGFGHLEAKSREYFYKCRAVSLFFLILLLGMLLSRPSILQVFYSIKSTALFI